MAFCYRGLWAPVSLLRTGGEVQFPRCIVEDCMSILGFIHPSSTIQYYQHARMGIEADEWCMQVVWTAGEADAVVLTRLKNASVIHGFHEEKVVLHMAVARADTPGGTVSAANFGHEEEVQVRLAVELLPPKVGLAKALSGK